MRGDGSSLLVGRQTRGRLDEIQAHLGARDINFYAQKMTSQPLTASSKLENKQRVFQTVNTMLLRMSELDEVPEEMVSYAAFATNLLTGDLINDVATNVSIEKDDAYREACFRALKISYKNYSEANLVAVWREGITLRRLTGLQDVVFQDNTRSFESALHTGTQDLVTETTVDLGLNVVVLAPQPPSSSSHIAVTAEGDTLCGRSLQVRSSKCVPDPTQDRRLCKKCLRAWKKVSLPLSSEVLVTRNKSNPFDTSGSERWEKHVLYFHEAAQEAESAEEACEKLHLKEGHALAQGVIQRCKEVDSASTITDEDAFVEAVNEWYYAKGDAALKEKAHRVSELVSNS